MNKKTNKLDMTKEEEIYYRKVNQINEDLKYRKIIPKFGCCIPEMIAAGMEEEDIDLEKLREYRRRHPTDFAKREIQRYLSKRTQQKFPDNEDILVHPVNAPHWMHKQMYIRAKCLELLEGFDDPPWKEHGYDASDFSSIVPTEGWLLVEEARIVGMTKFSKAYIGHFNKFIWVWDSLFIDPEYMRKGYTSKRLAKWVKRYGRFLIDQPNPAARAMLEKTGYAKVLFEMDLSLYRIGIIAISDEGKQYLESGDYKLPPKTTFDNENYPG